MGSTTIFRFDFTYIFGPSSKSKATYVDCYFKDLEQAGKFISNYVSICLANGLYLLKDYCFRADPEMTKLNITFSATERIRAGCVFYFHECAKLFGHDVK